MTPAMASDPYCAEAPSRRTSDPFDCAHGDRVHVGTRGAASYRPVDVDERAAVTPLPIEQHQHLVRSHSSQRRGAHGVRPVADRRTRKIERGDQPLDGPAHFKLSRVTHVFLFDEVYRHGGIRYASALDPASDNDDFLKPGRRFRGIGLLR